MKQYKTIVVDHMGTDACSENVSSHLNDGWKLYGSPFVRNDSMHQAIVRDSETNQPTKAMDYAFTLKDGNTEANV